MNKKGFTISEIIFVAFITVIVISSILSVWLFSYRSWNIENRGTNLRIDLMKALEVMKKDSRLSSLTYMSFYPEGSDEYEGMSIPLADTDANGLLTLDTDGKIVWDRTVIYHLFQESDGSKTLRRTVIDPRDNTMTEEERYDQLEAAVSSGTVSGGETDTAFLKNVETFTVSSLSPVIDFYDPSSIPVREGKIVFGWAKMDPGEHTIKFEVTGKNVNSSGYNIGIDNIMIEPCGSVRDVEYYNSSFAPSGALTLNLGTANRIYNPTWSNNNYFEFQASGVGAYMEITDYYDLWRESSFESCALTNLGTEGEEEHVALEVPEESHEGNASWYAYSEAADPARDGRDGSLPDLESPPITIRTVITQDNISIEGDVIRVKFSSSGSSQFVIDKAYITARNGTSGYNGLANQSPGGLDVEDYHRHQQLFFTDLSGNKTEGVTIPAGGEVWSAWTAFPFRQDMDYFITVYISDVSSSDCLYWEGATTDDRTYYIVGADYTTTARLAGTPDWDSVLPAATLSLVSDEDIFIVTKINVETISGSIESQIFDTGLLAPNYSEIGWSASGGSGTTVNFKARSSANEDMSGATDWDAISGSTSNPASLSISSDRYIQFYGELESSIVWESPGLSLGYEPYITSQISLPVDQFPSDAAGNPLVTGVYSTWIDDVQIDWPGDDRICTITGYIAKKNNYGQAKVIIDGEELVKVLGIHAVVSLEYNGETYSADNYLEIEPRNTGR